MDGSSYLSRGLITESPARGLIRGRKEETDAAGKRTLSTDFEDTPETLHSWGVITVGLLCWVYRLSGHRAVFSLWYLGKGSLGDRFLS